MTVRFGGLAACMFVLTLAACGGGGSGGGGPAAPGNNNPDGNWLTFNPAAPSVTQYEGESVAVTVNATSSRLFTAPFNLAIIDPTGVITNQVSVSASSQTAYVASLRTAAGLAAGPHTTVLEVRVCEDAPLTCAKPFPGSPWRLPLTVQVKPKADAAARLTLSVPSVSVTTYAGEAASFSFEAQLNPELAAQVVNIGVFDPASITVVPSSKLTLAADGHYVFNLSTATANALPAGTYTSDLQLRMCHDDVRTCQQPVAGSPWSVALTVNVKSPINLSALTAIDGLSSWTTYQGNAAHTGFADASFDPAAFSRRWRLPSLINYTHPYGSTAVDGGRAFVVRRGVANHWELWAVSEDTGELAWKVDLGTLLQVNAPAAANGRVYVTSQFALWVYDQATGAEIRHVPMNSQGNNYSAPTVFGTDVYSINGYYGGIGRYSEAEGKFSWSVGLTVEAGWSPSADGRFVYTYSTPDNILVGLNAADGSRAYSIGPPYPYSTYFTASAVVLTDTQQAIVVSGNLMAFDLASHTRSWILSTATTGAAAFGNGTIYAFGPGGRTLEAHAPATGNQLWASSDLNDVYTEVIVTRNLAFVSSTTTTLAIDLTTHKVVWTYPQGGNLAISPRGVLYILNHLGALAAVNLR